MEPNQPTLIEVKSFFKEHPAILGSLLYLQVLCLGFIYYWVLFSAFRINIFDFAGANDFLLAAFKDPQVLVLAMVSVALLALQTWFFKTRASRFSKFPLVTTALVLAVLYTIGTPIVLARRNAELIKSDLRLPITIISKADSVGSDGKANKKRAVLIGTTEKYAFFFDRGAQLASAIPLDSIARIEFAPSRGPLPGRKVKTDQSKGVGSRKKGA